MINRPKQNHTSLLFSETVFVLEMSLTHLMRLTFKLAKMNHLKALSAGSFRMAIWRVSAVAKPRGLSSLALELLQSLPNNGLQLNCWYLQGRALNPCSMRTPNATYVSNTGVR